uniref:response regulator n=1 Tax=Variovorax paradoxus TaxID=34073 RepID=UPI00247A0447
MTRIVIVEDEADIASVVQDYLRHAGYETAHFADGQSALESIVASPPDLTLLDIMLPRLDGIEVLRAQPAPISMSGAIEPGAGTRSRSRAPLRISARTSAIGWAL